MAEHDEIPNRLEDVPERPIDSERVLSDDELRSGGLEPVRAYVRTKAGKAAQRQQRYRERKESAGLKQTNVQVPEQHQETIREIARRMREGEPLGDVIGAEKPQAQSAPTHAAEGESAGALTGDEKRLLDAARAGGVRSRLIRFLAGL